MQKSRLRQMFSADWTLTCREFAYIKYYNSYKYGYLFK